MVKMGVHLRKLSQK